MNANLPAGLLVLAALNCISSARESALKGGNTLAVTGTDVGFQTLLEGARSPSKNFNQGPGFHWIRSDSAWSKSIFAVWLSGASTAGQASPGGAPIGPDFTKQDVLVFTHGDVGSSGHSISLLKIERNGKTAFHLKSTKPGKMVPTAQVMQNPFHMVLVDKGLPSTDPEFLLDGKQTAFTVHIED